MTYGLPWSEKFVCQLADKKTRDEFVADQIRTRISLMIKHLREDCDRDWSQSELGQRMGKRQNVVSRFEDPDYGRMSLASLLEVAAAFDLPLWVDMPNWDDWLRCVRKVPSKDFCRKSFDLDDLAQTAKIASIYANHNVKEFSFYAPAKKTSTKHNNRGVDYKYAVS